MTYPYKLRLPWGRPPLSLNQRPNRWRKAEVVAQVRNTTVLLARSARVPAMVRPSVMLVWLVPDMRRRDADNVVATLKACCDGLVDAGVARDDTPEFMHKAMPLIVPAPDHAWAPGVCLLVKESTGWTAEEREALNTLEVAV